MKVKDSSICIMWKAKSTHATEVIKGAKNVTAEMRMIDATKARKQI